jgi:hypothetical protein
MGLIRGFGCGLVDGKKTNKTKMATTVLSIGAERAKAAA